MATTSPKTEKPKAPKKTTAAKKADNSTAVKKTSATKKAAPKRRKISPEERYRMIEVAAYYLAENNGFQGSTLDYWVAAEAQIDTMLSM